MVVVWFTDNQSVTKIVTSGSKVPELQNIALAIFSVCVAHGTNLDIQWIPRNQQNSRFR